MTSRLRRYAQWLSATPFHPQWLMPKRNVGNNVRKCRGTVLDIGCADGRLKSCLDPKAVHIGLDYPVTAILLYRTRPHVFGDASNLPFSDGCVDVVACYEVLEHVCDLVQSVTEIARVLKPGGYAEFSMPFLYLIHDLLASSNSHDQYFYHQ
ncbi:MAG: class I SAM-dependent methyltransferase [Burkholderiaceae bacterium]|jgi:2-polyprenyl-3-methyl-5-hydroxy-6-metoxy-1,4-benzoquinol methylase|nr:class I SAM-dependent methyltransferase [Burkholderiaceae bacterium]